MKTDISRRNFLKRLGLGASVTGLALAGCNSAGNKHAATSSSALAEDGKMTYRTNPKTGEKVSILGYGCMRWPTKAVGNPEDKEDEIDQETVNDLIDTAIANGVNYFDTSPAYCKGRSERATGIALSRHPRDSYYIATKLSNFSPSTWSREASIGM